MFGPKGLVFAAAALLVVACSSTPEQAGGAGGGGSADGAGLLGGERGIGGPFTAGTQSDLVANIGDRVFFDYDRFEVKAEGQSTLSRQAEWLKTYPNLKLVVEGHCDERGTREYNLALGESRANAAKNFLVDQGIAANRIRTISYGKERPAVPGSDESAWAQNRRAVSVVAEAGT
jgi:peptidoglycan-associated lipoprotein